MAALVAVWGFGLIRYAASIPSELQDDGGSTDAIVVLTGGSGRLSTGLELLAKKRAHKLFVSGVYQGVDVAKLLALSQQAPEELRCCVEIGHSADNTAGNATETAAWARRNGSKSLRIVTSSYHMPRSLLELRHALPGVTLVSHPIFSVNVKQERWWVWPGTASLIMSEYNKYLLARLRIFAARMFGSSGTAAP